MFSCTELFWAVGRFEKIVAETRWVAMKERKMNIHSCMFRNVENCEFCLVAHKQLLPDPYQHTETFSVGNYGKHPQLRLCHVPDGLLPDLGPQITTGVFHQERITREVGTALVGVTEIHLGV